MSMNVQDYVSSLIERSRAAQAVIETYTQAQVDELCAAITYNGTKDEFAKEVAARLVEESGMGFAPHKYGKQMVKVKGTYRDMKDEKSVGVIERDEAKGLIKVAKPIGVIGALVPVTNGEATPFCKAITALKGRNSIILAPHPKAKNTNWYGTENIRATLKKYNAPEDLVIAIDPEMVSIEASAELMKQCDTILATGGSAMVKDAYSSGTPAIGVGTGNATTIIDGTTDLDAVADMVMRSKTFDFATSCSTENNCIVNEDCYDEFIAACERAGGFLVKNGSEEKAKLKEAIWPDGHTLSRHIVAQSPEVISEVSGVKFPEGTKFVMVEEDGIGADHQFSGEKLSVITTLHKYTDFANALETLDAILDYQGAGHSCGIHTKHDFRVLEIADKAKASRIMVNQPQCLANSGAWTNGMPMSMTLGCGTWGNNSVSHNVTWKDLINVAWVSMPIPSTQPTDEELFPASVVEFNK